MAEIVDAIQSFDGLLSLGAVDPSEIEKAESELALSFAREYKDYTSTFGAISFGGKEFTGAVQPANLNVVSITKAARNITPTAKPDWYVVLDPHFDGIIIWQDNTGAIYQTEPGREPRKVSESLIEYMKNA